MAIKMKKPKILFLRSNPCDPDPRVEKEATALAKIAKIKIIAWDREGRSLKREKLSYAEIERLKLKAPYGSITLFFRLFVWFLFVFSRALTEDYDVIHACDLDTYLPSLLAVKLRRKKIVYDVFDFYADMLPLPSFITRPIAFLDRYLMRFADHLILVDEARLSQIQPARFKKISYIYNIPEFKKEDLRVLRQKKIKGNYFFYAGMLAKDRHIEEVLKLFSRHQNLQIEIAGWGPLAALVKKYERRYKNIKFLGKVDYKTVLEKTAFAKAVIAFYDPLIPNNRFASPNKLFEALALGKPLITNKGTNLAKFVQKHKVGFAIGLRDFSAILEVVNSLSDRRLRAIKDRCFSLYSKKYNWDIMKKRLLDIYSELLKS